jgi:cytochrome c oxidase cbb3-type subunit III
MSSRCRNAAATAMLALGLAACDREDRDFRGTPPGASPTAVVRQSPLQPGPLVISSHVDNEYEENAYQLAQGQRLYAWYNCAGCHANGGGGMGPPLMDETWVYGSEPEQIYATIMQGRPNGMPSWAGRIPEAQVWQIVSYVRAMSGLVPQNVRSSRPDHMMTLPKSQTIMDPKQPVQSFLPPPSQQP